jgi:hypothetical protein
VICNFSFQFIDFKRSRNKKKKKKTKHNPWIIKAKLGQHLWLSTMGEASR